MMNISCLGTPCIFLIFTKAFGFHLIFLKSQGKMILNPFCFNNKQWKDTMCGNREIMYYSKSIVVVVVVVDGTYFILFKVIYRLRDKTTSP